MSVSISSLLQNIMQIVGFAKMLNFRSQTACALLCACKNSKDNIAKRTHPKNIQALGIILP